MRNCQELADLSTQYVFKRGQNIERFLNVPIGSHFSKLAATDLIRPQRFGTALYQSVGSHIVVRAHQECAQGVNQAEIPVTAIAGTEQIAHQRLELVVTEFLVEKFQKLLLFPRPDIIQIVNRFRLLQFGVILFVVSQAGVIENHHLHRMAVTPKVFVVLFDRVHHVAQSIGWDSEHCFCVFH